MAREYNPTERGHETRWHRPLEELCCMNPDCADCGRAGAGNLCVRPTKGGLWRVLACSSCKTEFSERKGTPLWGTKMPPERAEAIAMEAAAEQAVFARRRASSAPRRMA